MKIERKNRNEYRVEIPTRNNEGPKVTDLHKWCRKMYGDSGKDRKYNWRVGWTVRHNLGEITYFFYFRKEKDAAFFVLTWA